MLLKPWRNVKTDLKVSSQSWEDAFQEFLVAAPNKIINILSGIQYYHQCRWSAKQQAQQYEGWDDSIVTAQTDGMQTHTDNVNGVTGISTQITEERLRVLQSSEKVTMEDLHAFSAIESARFTRLFEERDSEAWTEAEKRSNSPVDLQFALGGRRCENGDLQNMIQWKAQMEADIQRQNPDFNATSFPYADEDDLGTVLSLDKMSNTIAEEPGISYLHESRAEEALSAVDPSMLRYDQFRAYDIITGHLQETLAGRNPPPLRMLIHGEPGTGKSKVIQTTTEHFICRAAKHMLMKSAYTGVASSIIDGKTTHSIAVISPRKDGTLNAKSRRKLQRIWKHIKYLVIDEVSMISKTFMAKLSCNISIGKMTDGDNPSANSFGGISVILCGDFFQFPPVAGGVSDALYNPACNPKNPIDSQTGRIIFEEFTTVVSLTEQMRVTDPTWQEFLQHLRYSQVTQTDIDMLRELVLTKKGAKPIDFTQDPWDKAALVTPRHAVRRLWNETALLKHGKKARRMILECNAEETIRGQPLTLQEKFAAYARQKNLDSNQQKQELPLTVQMAIGMKVMVTQNVVTDLDITNGARGTIVDIWLHPDEPAITEVRPILKLKHSPVCVLVKLDRTRTSRLNGLEESVIPVEPTTQTYRITCQGSEGNTIQRSVRRRQFPITAAYAFTDYRSQGQTLPAVIVDIATPPTGKVSTVQTSS